MIRLRAIAAALLLAALPAAAAAADTVVLLRLVAVSDPKVELEVAQEAGTKRLDPVPAAAIWRLAPGDVLEQRARPPERVIELYSGTALAPNLLATVVVRYFPSAAGWVPHFRLDELPVVARVGGRWQPLLLPGGVGPLVRYGNTLPNAEGFFPLLEFGPPGGLLPIAAWRVR